MKVIQNGQMWIYTPRTQCEVCGAQLDFVPVLLEDGYKVCPACASTHVRKYFHPDTVAFGDCGCRDETRCDEYFDAVETWRTAAEFAVRRGKPRDEWRAKWWRVQVILHDLRSRREEIVHKIQQNLVEELHHWIVQEKPPLEEALANVRHVCDVADFMTQGYAHKGVFKKALEEMVQQTYSQLLQKEGQS